jgi:hypothetical protein
MRVIFHVLVPIAIAAAQGVRREGVVVKAEEG